VTATGSPNPVGVAAAVGVEGEGRIGVPTGVAWGVATTGGVGVRGWGVVIAAVEVGARVGAGIGLGVAKRAGVGVGAVAGAGWPVGKAVLAGWLRLGAAGGGAWTVASGKGGAIGDDGLESAGDAPEPEAPEPVNAGSSAEDSSTRLRW
jgi:hypothetical protein